MQRKHIVTAQPSRAGSILILSALMLTMIFGFVAFSVDVGYIGVTKARLQNAADAAALAAAAEMITIRTNSVTSAYQAAEQTAAANSAGGKAVQITSDQDIEFGKWDEVSRDFQPLSASALDQADAVRVTCWLSPERGNQLKLFFSPILGMSETTVQAVAVARFEGGSIFPLALRCSEFKDEDIDNLEDNKDDDEDFEDDDDSDPKDDDEDNPHDLAPSKPKNGDHFEVGEEVILGYDDDDDDDNDHDEVTLVMKHGKDDLDDKEIINGEKEERGEKVKKHKHKDKDKDKDKKKKKDKKSRGYDEAKKRVDSHPPEHRLRDVSVPIVRPDESTRDPVTKKIHDLEVVDVVRVHLEGKKLVSITDPITGDVDVLEVIYGTVTGISKKSDPAGVGVGLKPLRRIKLVQ